MNEGHSLINLGELSKPATVLIEKIAEATGGVFRPFQIRRVAQAEADAELIKAAAKIEIADLEHRAMHRFLHEEAKKQANIESITQKALPAIDEKAQPEKIENDWITNFFDKCRLISDEQMQNLWSKILAGEANNPGKFSTRTVNLLASFDKTDAELFSSLCSFIWYFENRPIPFIYGFTDFEREIYVKSGLDVRAFLHLETIGLIKFQIGPNTFGTHGLPAEIFLTYHDVRVKIKFQTLENNVLNQGQVAFTRVGEELAFVSKSKPVSEFKEYALNWWKRWGYTATEV